MGYTYHINWLFGISSINRIHKWHETIRSGRVNKGFEAFIGASVVQNLLLWFEFTLNIKILSGKLPKKNVAANVHCGC